MHLKNWTLFRESFLLLFWIAGTVWPPAVWAANHRFDPAETLRFERLSSPEPPHRSIFAVHQDTDGFLWIGTQDGLARYDGYEMRTFRHDPNDPLSLSNSSIRVIIEDRQGRLWVGTENGLNRVDRHRLRIARIPTPGHRDGAGAWFHCGFEDRTGALWFGTDDGLLRFDPDTESFDRLRHEEGDQTGLADTAVVGIQEDRAGNLWIATSTGTAPTLHRLTPQGDCAARYPTDPTDGQRFAFLIDSRDRFWTHPSGPVRFNPKTDAFDSRPDSPFCLDAIKAMEAADGTVWFSCDDGTYRIDPITGSISNLSVVQSSGTWLENFARTIHEDRSGILWVGTEGGLYRFDPHTKTFSHIRRRPTDPKSLSADAVSAIAEAPDGDLWVATYGGGLNRVDRTTGEAQSICVDPGKPEKCTSGVIWHLHRSTDGTLWIAGDELWSLDPAGEKLTLHSPEGAITDYIIFLVEDSDGVLWIGGTEGRLYRHVIATGEFETMEFDFESRNIANSNRFDSILLDGDSLWLGTGDHLASYCPTIGSFEARDLETTEGDSLRSLGAWTIHRGDGDDLWIGTSVGLIRYAISDGRFHLLTTQDGLPGSAVFSILSDDQGAMWLGTNQGLTRFDPSQPPGKQFRNYTTRDGIGNLEFNRHAALECADGTMYFGGMDGLTGFHPSTIRDNPWVPPIQITDIQISSRQGTRNIEPGALDRLVLAHGDTTVAFTFAALNFTAPELNRYAYLMEGFDTAWTDAGIRRTTQYTNLPPGHYRFRVRGSNNDGVWNEEGVSLDVVVHPTLWETWWFRPMLAMVLAGIILAGCRYRIAKQREMERLRIRIAGDLHDDLSSDLSGIAVLADMMGQADGLGAEESNDLGQIRDASFRMADGLRDIVWYIDPDHDSLEAMIRRMRSVAGTMFRGLDHHFHTEVPERNLPLPVNTRRNVFLIYKEAVHNIVRHAQASRVEISIAVEGGRLELLITDNGEGFDPASADGGHGLRSMHRRAEETGADLQIDSTPGNGSELRLTVEMAGSRDGRPPGSASKVDRVESGN